MPQVDALLKARSAAIVGGQETEFLKTVDPANAKLVARQRQVFANLQKLGVRQVGFQRETEYVAEEKPESGQGAQAFRVRMLIQLTGIDAAARATPLGYTFAERGGQVVLVSDDDLAQEADRGTYREPWDLGPIEVVRRPGLLIVVPSQERANGVRLANEAAAALPAVRAATRRAQSGILVVALADKRSMSPEWQTGGHPAGAVATPNLAPSKADETILEVVGSRVVINPTERKTAGRLLLAHEFTHVVMAPLGNAAPTWMVEGLAEYVERRLAEQEGDDRPAKKRAELRRTVIPELTVLPIDGTFHGDYGDESYGVSWLIIEHLATTHGLPKVIALYTDQAKGPDTPAHRDQLLQKHLSQTEPQLLTALKK
ncbi:hypothetical protein HNR71_007066 [Kribbella sandramycini]|uniref:Basic secretory peptidase family protein n=1 Tax=Kribbella sandramycini TaxID=60450 RepID=A0A841SJG1_9ACTN|nr:hypothetical protein [Kribbella sandramycini]